MTENSAAPTPALIIQPIELLRALACLMVIYCHMVGRSIIVLQEHWGPHTLVSNFIIIPLGVIQDFGFLGVALFFLISGFIVTHTGLNETRWSFLAKRLLRIYPALIIAVGATVLLATQAAAAGWTDGAMGIGYTNALLSAVGLDTGLTGKAVLDVGWTITIELLFYAHLVVFLPLLKSRPTVTTLFFIAWSILLTYTGQVHPTLTTPALATLAKLCAFFPIFALGMTIYFGWSKKIALRTAAGLGIAAWSALIINFNITYPDKIALPNSHTVQVAYALFIFLAALWIYHGRQIRNAPPVTFFANISYSLYLIHLPFGAAAITFLYPQIGLTMSIGTAFVLVVTLASSIYFLIERPVQKTGRTLLSTRPTTTRSGSVL